MFRLTTAVQSKLASAGYRDIVEKGCNSFQKKEFLQL